MVLESLASRYKQLYLIPGEDNGILYHNVVARGADPGKNSLGLFKGNEKDRITTEHTPAGDIEVVFLAERSDFENFIRIMSCKCEKKDIPATTGAMTIDGIINWGKINSHKFSYIMGGGKDWGEEFKRFTSDKRNYCDTVIVLSDGFYSNISGEAAGMSDDEWRERSYLIRLYHECTHVICRRKYYDKKSAVFDEIIADAIGLISAFGCYDADKAALFLGVGCEGYMGGRLENYLNDDEKKDICSVSKRVYSMITALAEIITSSHGDVYDLLVYIMEEKYDYLTGILIKH